jgi:hypothetical protein
MMLRKTTLTLGLLAALAVAGLSLPSAHAQILFSAGSPYTQNFDSLGTVGSPWTDNSTLPSWYASKTLGGTTVTTNRADNGSMNSGSLYNYGLTGDSNRALGSIASGTPGNIAFGVRFQNDTALAITNITISYKGEQWRNGGNINTQTLAFTYVVSTTPVTTSDAVGNLYPWTPFTALDFLTPTVGATAAALDGTAATNSHQFTSVFLTNVVVFPGSELFLRWLDVNDSGNDHGVAVDNLSVSFTSVGAVVVPISIPPGGQPQSVTTNAGSKVLFTVSPNGSAPTFQWQLNGSPLFAGTKYSGINSATLTVNNVLHDDAGSYSVVVANTSNSVTSADAILTVIDPSVRTQPLSRTNIVGDTANFFVSAGGTVPLSYQWRFNGADIADATTSTLNVLNVQNANQGSYSVVVGNVLLDYTTSQVAQLSVLVPPPTNIVRWNFNDTNVITTTAPAPSTGSGSASLLTPVTASFTSGCFSDPAGPPGAANSGWNAANYPAQGTSNKVGGVQFAISTLGLQDLLLTWEERHSDTASKYIRLQYSIDGSTYIDKDVITMTLTNNDWAFYTVDFSSVPGVNNNPNFAVRFVSEFEATAVGGSNSNYVGTVTSYSSGGTVRYDLVSLYGNKFSGVTRIPLNIQQVGNNVVLTWSDPTFVLQQSTTVNGTYVDNLSATSPYTNAVSAAPKFYRLKRTIP